MDYGLLAVRRLSRVVKTHPLVLSGLLGIWLPLFPTREPTSYASRLPSRARLRRAAIRTWTQHYNDDSCSQSQGVPSGRTHPASAKSSGTRSLAKLYPCGAGLCKGTDKTGNVLSRMCPAEAHDSRDVPRTPVALWCPSFVHHLNSPNSGLLVTLGGVRGGDEGGIS